MQQLVLKDLLLQRKLVVLYLAYAFFLLLINFNNDALLTICCMTIPFIGTIVSVGHEVKNESEIILNSLPFQREEIVIAKYILASILIVIGIILSFLIGLIQHQLGTLDMNGMMMWGAMLGGIVGAILYVSIALPIGFGMGHISSKYIALFVGTIFAFSSGMIVKNLWMNVENQWSSSLFVNAILLTGIFLIYVASMVLSVSLYKERDL
ncbi:ABC-2 transporter permease [Bacillus gaemokensis]|uniref:ABC transporter permease n=1 Tax=Bacillus gaemokensis TaxID=574375 RepID=A0A073KHT4_9BACI|nr:ABC-2 transporter permease [Bacillus gaemokensis]KEK26150.1 ABC transporter permease [Bacillus gaemokensis]KYG38959.1 ABC transporter permease [Bacillus gaemokensis]